MSATGTLTTNYGSFFKWNAHLAFSPYIETYNIFNSHPTGHISDGLGEAAGIMLCLIASPYLLPATVFTASLALVLSLFAASLAPLAYAGAVIADGLSVFGKDNPSTASAYKLS